MSNLTNIERLKLEKMFEMGDGCVLDFSNRTIQEFVLDSTGLDIYDAKYSCRGKSKANHLRAFWDKESDYVLAKFIGDALEYWKTRQLIQGREIPSNKQALFDECSKIVNRMKGTSTVENADVLVSVDNDKNFQLLASAIKASIEKNEPELAIDRLHTFITKYCRDLCDRRGILYTKETPLHSLFGGYLKQLREDGLIQSEMTDRILKSSISVLEAFNDVRNKQSLAHDNSILNYHESILIFNDIANVIRFIQSIDPIKQTQKNSGQELKIEAIPF